VHEVAVVGREIERKFLVKSDAWRTGARGDLYRQGYLARQPERTVRVRLAKGRGFLTIKGAGKLDRAEYEYEIPATDAAELLGLCERPLIEKTRYEVLYEGTRFEIDEFAGDNAGLVVAEVELAQPEGPFARPPWLGAEVTEDERYTNASLVTLPYKRWQRS
jgi:adenylate cyclase